jgi:hypothetical protein
MRANLLLQLKHTAIFLLGGVTFYLPAQVTPLKSPPSGGNKKAMVAEQIGITQVTIHYDRPGVKGREGKIYGASVVHRGFIDKSTEYGTSTAAPWRAGANENTTIEFSTDVKIEGKELEAGKYGLFVAYDEAACIVIFSKDHQSWGNYFYDEKHDALRVTVKPVQTDKSVEWLKYEFAEQTDNSATIALQWEKLSIPFKVEVDLIKTQLETYREELKGDRGFRAESWTQASAFCLKHNTNLEEGLRWAKLAVTYQKDFNTLTNLSQFHEQLNHAATADSLLTEAMPLGTMTELHQYGRRLTGVKKPAKAIEVFKFNAKKHPGDFTTYVGLARGYSANGDFKNALANAKAALPKAPNDLNKQSVTEMIKKLEDNKDIN